MSSLNNDELKRLSSIIGLCKTLIISRRCLYPIKEDLINTYCRSCEKCHKETDAYTSCSDCLVNTALNFISEVLG